MKKVKKFSSKKLAALCLSLFILTILAGCGSNSSGGGTNSGASDGNSNSDNSSADTAQQPAASSESKEIIFWNIGTEDIDKSIYNKAIDKFNETTTSGYHITSVPVQNDAYKEKLVIAMSSGEAPDMYIHWSGGPMIEYINSGFAQPITELFNASPLKDRLMDANVAQGTYNGEVYAIGFQNVSLSGIYYNKAMFAEYGLSVPKTISELETVCETLKSNNITPFALANAPKWTGSMYFMNLAARKGGLEPFASAVAGTGTFEDECFIYAGDKIREWVEKGYFPEGVNSLSEDDGQGRQMLYQKTAAMDLIGSWYTGIIKQDSEEFFQDIGWFPFPAVDGSNADSSIMIGTIGDNFISFNCTGDKLAAAFECVSYFSDPENVDFAVGLGKVPPVKGVETKLTDPISIDIITAANKASATQLWYDQYLPPAVANVHLDTSQELFGLTMSSADAAKKLQDAMQTHLAENK